MQSLKSGIKHYWSHVGTMYKIIFSLLLQTFYYYLHFLYISYSKRPLLHYTLLTTSNRFILTPIARHEKPPLFCLSFTFKFIFMSTLLSQQFEFSRSLSKLLAFLHSRGYECSIGEVFRPQEMQNLYFKRGYTKVLYSRHQEKKAVDLAIFKNGVELTRKEEFKEIAEYWVSINPRNVAGYFWDWDLGHFEMK